MYTIFDQLLCCCLSHSPAPKKGASWVACLLSIDTRSCPSLAAASMLGECLLSHCCVCSLQSILSQLGENAAKVDLSQLDMVTEMQMVRRNAHLSLYQQHLHFACCWVFEDNVCRQECNSVCPC